MSKLFGLVLFLSLTQLCVVFVTCAPYGDAVTGRQEEIDEDELNLEYAGGQLESLLGNLIQAAQLSVLVAQNSPTSTTLAPQQQMAIIEPVITTTTSTASSVRPTTASPTTVLPPSSSSVGPSPTTVKPIDDDELEARV